MLPKHGMNHESQRLSCPVCLGELVATSLLGTTVDRCDICLGTWFDDRELGLVVRATEPKAEQLTSAVGGELEIRCPACRIGLNRVVYAHDSGVPIYKCPGCAGVWLFRGQLEQLANYRSGKSRSDALEPALAKDLAVENRWSRVAEIIQSRLLSAAVALGLLIAVFLLTNNIAFVLQLMAYIIFPLSCIWFPDAMGNLTGVALGLARPRITAETPGVAVAVGGWIVLIVVTMVVLIPLL